MISDKGTFSTPPSVFATPVHKGKPQGRAELGIDECAFCKEKGHWKAQCPKKFRGDQKNFQKNFKSSSSNVATVAAPSTIGYGSNHVYSSETTSQISNITEQLQKLLATQSHVMSASSVVAIVVAPSTIGYGSNHVY
ncbi:gag-pol polyprotein [Trifolium pratense]|uniref:Gag-pol polyprotein n=1 Tax=Trifolium pratense TaxID=57577 RepID=A0A2K3JJV4_TRIPR|nr:gag-pol polyprotein [Trifolium pratense]